MNWNERGATFGFLGILQTGLKKMTGIKVQEDPQEISARTVSTGYFFIGQGRKKPALVEEGPKAEGDLSGGGGGNA